MVNGGYPDEALWINITVPEVDGQLPILPTIALLAHQAMAWMLMGAARPSCRELSWIKSAKGQQHRPKKLLNVFRSILQFLPAPLIANKWWTKPLAQPRDCWSHGSRLVVGTLFGQRNGRVHLAVQEDPRLPPVLLLELATPTNALVKEMASGLVKIALECNRTSNKGKLFQEPLWIMYCNGRKNGFATRRVFSELDLRILSLLQAVSMGAGILPIEEEGCHGEILYMRARFDRVVGSRDSEALYMMNPDGQGAPDLSIFLLRL